MLKVHLPTDTEGEVVSEVAYIWKWIDYIVINSGMKQNAAHN